MILIYLLFTEAPNILNSARQFILNQQHLYIKTLTSSLTDTNTTWDFLV